MNIEQLTDEQLLELGLYAEALLADENFQALMRFGGQLIAEQFLALPLERRDQLTELHLAKCSYDLFEKNLKTFKDAKDQIVDRRNAASAPPSDEL